jgi:PBP1b-binding outer membrane lipoprotein LpoB
MTKISTVLLLVVFLISCSNNSKRNKVSVTENKVKLTNVGDAKQTSKQIFEYIEQVEDKIISKKQLDKIAKPLQAHLDSLRPTLMLFEKQELDA